jgi:FAD/FMN-containing dehydrogenase
MEPCKTDPQSQACATALKNAQNPFFLEDHPEATQSTGWLKAWDSAESPYVIAAENAEDVVAGVNFAREHNLRVAIKGTGHDYLGRSNSPNSLLIWTHKMRKVTLHDSFSGQGCSTTQPGVPAVTVEAGTRWLETFKEVITNHGRYVQGGGCTSVGAAGGFPQGGGFGSFSKKFGTGAANMLEAEVVTADGKILIANACQNQDLFWALRGGGGSTFGVVTKMTYRTHTLPQYFGIVEGQITASSDQAFKQLLEQFIHFYRESLNNEHWGEQIHVKGDNSLKLALLFQGLNKEDVEKIWQPFKEWLAKKPELFKIETKISEIPPQKMWDYAFIDKHSTDIYKAIQESPNP